jgi:two-component system OmpR family response regulator
MTAKDCQMKQKLLLVDDDDNIRFVAELSLEDDWEVQTANSGRQALEFAAINKPNVVILDMMMPDMTGATTFEHLRAMAGFDQIPIIFMTAKVQRDEVEAYLALGATGVILKPFDPMSLSDEISKLIGINVGT